MQSMDLDPQEDVPHKLLSAVEDVMQVESFTTGDEKQGYMARFSGRLLIDSQEAYQRLESVFAQYETTPKFRVEGDDHVVLALPGVVQVQASNPWINLIFFLLTVVTMLMAGAIYSFQDAGLVEEYGLWGAVLRSLPDGIPFAATLLAILTAHEFGHYLAARYHKTAVTLPYFLPFPGSLFGTLGAFIRLKAPPRNRRVLLDIGLAGPLAGLVFAIPLLFWGLSLSEIDVLPDTVEAFRSVSLEGNSILYLLAKFLVTGEWLPAPVDYGGLPSWLYWIKYILLGQPAPLGARDVLLHPIAWAAIVIGLVGLGFVWPGWFLWAGMIFFMGQAYAQPMDEITPLDSRRKALAIFGLVIFLLVFIPVPLSGFMT